MSSKEQTMIFRCAEHDIYKGNGSDTWWYQFAASKELDKAEIFRAENAIRSCLQPLQEFEQRDYVTASPINFFGTFIPAGTEYRRVNPDYWHPIINGARCPNYEIHFSVIENNPTYFTRK